MHNESEGRLRVLVAEDHHDVREGIVGLLDPVFEIVAVVSTGRELVDAAMALEPDVIVSDLRMPSLTGAEALAMLRSAGHTIAFVLQTTTGRNAQAWLDMGALGVVDKFDLRFRPRDRRAIGRGGKGLPLAKHHQSQVAVDFTALLSRCSIVGSIGPSMISGFSLRSFDIFVRHRRRHAHSRAERLRRLQPADIEVRCNKNVTKGRRAVDSESCGYT